MYTLNIRINSTGRQFLLDNNETIVLVFPPDAGYQYAVACVSFSPFGDNNTVVFQDTWVEYASSQSIHLNEVINMAIEQNVNKGNVYIFNGVDIVPGGPAYSKEVYGLYNKRVNDSNNLTCGLAQSIVVNGADAEVYSLSVYSTPHTQTTYFQSTTKVLIFVASGIDTGMIIATQMLTPDGSINKNNRFSGGSTVGNCLEIDLAQTSTVIFDSTINAFRL